MNILKSRIHAPFSLIEKYNKGRRGAEPSGSAELILKSTSRVRFITLRYQSSRETRATVPHLILCWERSRCGRRGSSEVVGKNSN